MLESIGDGVIRLLFFMGRLVEERVKEIIEVRFVGIGFRVFWKRRC